MYRGAAYGLAAGIGAVTLPKPMGLNNAPVTKTTKTKILAVAWYLFGGVVSAVVMNQLKKQLTYKKGLYLSYHLVNNHGLCFVFQAYFSNFFAVYQLN